MTFDPIKLFENLGVPVAFICVMIYLFLKEQEKAKEERKEHREERKEWRESQEKLQNNTNSALEKLTEVINNSGK